MSMRAVLTCGGEFCPQKFFVENCDTIVAVDKGYEYIKDIACPQYVVGDFDSLGYVPEGVNVIKHNPIKDYTDTQLAIEFLLEKGYDEFVSLFPLSTSSLFASLRLQFQMKATFNRHLYHQKLLLSNKLCSTWTPEVVRGFPRHEILEI